MTEQYFNYPFPMHDPCGHRATMDIIGSVTLEQRLAQIEARLQRIEEAIARGLCPPERS